MIGVVPARQIHAASRHCYTVRHGDSGQSERLDGVTTLVLSVRSPSIWERGLDPARDHDLPLLTVDARLARASGLDIAVQFVRVG